MQEKEVKKIAEFLYSNNIFSNIPTQSASYCEFSHFKKSILKKLKNAFFFSPLYIT
jgi:hypothetical protein